MSSDSTVGLRSAGESWSIHLVTVDPDGDSRVTRLWIARVAGDLVLRSGDSRWFQNLARDPDACLVAGGIAHPVRAESIEDETGEDAVKAALRAKYGWQAWLVMGMRPNAERDHFLRLVPRPQAAARCLAGRGSEHHPIR